MADNKPKVNLSQLRSVSNISKDRRGGGGGGVLLFLLSLALCIERHRDNQEVGTMANGSIHALRKRSSTRLQSADAVQCGSSLPDLSVLLLKPGIMIFKCHLQI